MRQAFDLTGATLGSGLEYITDPAANNVGVRLSSQYQSMILAEANLLSYWPLDNSWADSKGTHNGSPGGGATFGAGKYGSGSVALNGTSGYVGMGNVLTFSGQATPFSAEAWVYLVATPSTETIISSEGMGTINCNYLFYINSSRQLSFTQLSSDGLYHNVWSTATSISLGSWHYVAVTYNGAGASGCQLYIDGAAQSITTSYYGGWLVQGTPTFQIGARSGGTLGFFPGNIDEVAIYSAALSASQIAAHYAATCYSSLSPVATLPWQAIAGGAITATDVLYVAENAGAKLAGYSAYGTLMYQYALNGGTWNGVWLTQAQLAAALAGTAITDHTSSLQLQVQFNSNGSVPADVITGSYFGATAGGAGAYPLPVDVRAGIQYNSPVQTGTLDLPPVNDVRSGVQFDGASKTGNIVLPPAVDVAQGIGYGSQGIELTGTAVLTATYNLPLEVIDISDLYEVIEL